MIKSKWVNRNEGIFNEFDKDIKSFDAKLKALAYSTTHQVKMKMSWKNFNEMIGLPKHPVTLEPQPLMKYQNDWQETVWKVRSRWKKYHVKKGRQMGFTDVMMRIFAFGGFDYYMGKKVLNVAGTREKTAKKNHAKLRYLFNNIENQIADNGTDLYFKLKNGTEYEALPANGAVRGDSKIAAIGLDEAAHFKIVDDFPILNAFVPIAESNESDFFLWSTPNGKARMFYHLDEGDLSNNDYFKVSFPLPLTEGGLYTKEKIAEMLNKKDVDVAQEYLCQYTTVRDAIFMKEFDEDPSLIAEDYSLI